MTPSLTADETIARLKAGHRLTYHRNRDWERGNTTHVYAFTDGCEVSPVIMQKLEKDGLVQRSDRLNQERRTGHHSWDQVVELTVV